MTYFKIRTVDWDWLGIEIAKGTIFYKHYSFSTPEWVNCGQHREGGSSYESLTVLEVLAMISRDKNVYWRN